jgi:hypothetical protein
VPQVFVRRDAARADEARTDRSACADGGGRAWKAVLAANVRCGDRLRIAGDGRAERAGAVVVRNGLGRARFPLPPPRARLAVQCSGEAAAEIRNGAAISARP